MIAVVESIVDDTVRGLSKDIVAEVTDDTVVGKGGRIVTIAISDVTSTWQITFGINGKKRGL